MPYQQHSFLTNDQLDNFVYGFFTNEKGSSAGGYLVDGKPTRNVNLFAPDRPINSSGFDTSENISSNIQACLKELGGVLQSQDRGFLITANYAGMTKKKNDPDFGKLLVTVINNSNLEQIYNSGVESSKIFLNSELHQKLTENKIAIIKSDAIVLTNITREDIGNVYVGGFTADAHPVMLIDDEARICGYISASHHVLSSSGLQTVIRTMVENGADTDRISVLVGPGLGPKSYEMGQTIRLGSGDSTEVVNIHEYFHLLNDDSQQVLTRVSEEKYLLNAPLLLLQQAQSMGIKKDNFLDMELNSMGYDLYELTSVDSSLGTSYHKISQEPEPANSCCFLFNSARRFKPNADDPNPGKYNDVARTACLLMQKNKPYA